MEHLVWPAVRAGEITQAPNPQQDNPAWWSEGIAPIFEDARVYMLHWKGGKKKARGSWTHVCAELAAYEFARVERTEGFRQKNAEEFWVAAGYSVESGASTSTGNERTEEGEAEVAYATASAARLPAGDAAVAEAFWKIFADEVMDHLVWPAMHKGHINAAPKADVDPPEWWERGILQILEHPRVYMLHITGGKKAATSCWTFVCDQLANHVCVEAAAGEGFTQKNVGISSLQQGTRCLHVRGAAAAAKTTRWLQEPRVRR